MFSVYFFLYFNLQLSQSLEELETVLKIFGSFDVESLSRVWQREVEVRRAEFLDRENKTSERWVEKKEREARRNR